MSAASGNGFVRVRVDGVGEAGGEGRGGVVEREAEVKTLEILDSMTFIPVLAFQLAADNPIQAYYIHARCGYPKEGTIVLMRLSDGTSANSPYNWPISSRTMRVAHEYILDHWSELNDGDAIDIEYILGETVVKKTPERMAGTA